MALQTDTFTLSFLGKEYHFPADLAFYYDLCATTSNMDHKMYTEFRQSIAGKSGMEIFDENELNRIVNEAAEVYEGILRDRGVFSLTANDLGVGSHAYAKVIDTLRQGQDAFRLMEDKYLKDRSEVTENARRSAETKAHEFVPIILSDNPKDLFGVSEITVLMYGNRHYQAKKQYHQETSAGYGKAYREWKEAQHDYTYGTYTSAMSRALTENAKSMQDLLLGELKRAGKFDPNALKYASCIPAMSQLAKLDTTDNPSAVLAAAFQACPNYLYTFIEAANAQLLDEGTCETMERLGLKGVFLLLMQSTYEDLPVTDDLIEGMSVRRPYIRALHLAGGEDEDELIHAYLQPFYQNLIDYYKTMFSVLHSETKLRCWLKKMNADPSQITPYMIELILEAAVDLHIFWGDYGILKKYLGEETLLQEIAQASGCTFQDKTEADHYLKEKLAEALGRQLSVLQEKYEELTVQKAEYEREAPKKIKIRARAAFILLILLLILPGAIRMTSFIVLASSIKQNMAKTFDLRLESSMAESMGITGYEIRNMKFYRNRSSGIYYVNMVCTFYCGDSEFDEAATRFHTFLSGTFPFFRISNCSPTTIKLATGSTWTLYFVSGDCTLRAEDGRRITATEFSDTYLRSNHRTGSVPVRYFPLVSLGFDIFYAVYFLILFCFYRYAKEVNFWIDPAFNMEEALQEVYERPAGHDPAS